PHGTARSDLTRARGPHDPEGPAKAPTSSIRLDQTKASIGCTHRQRWPPSVRMRASRAKVAGVARNHGEARHARCRERFRLSPRTGARRIHDHGIEAVELGAGERSALQIAPFRADPP